MKQVQIFFLTKEHIQYVHYINVVNNTYSAFLSSRKQENIIYLRVCATNELSLEDVSGPFCATDKQQQQHNHIKGNVHT